jgi:hypothetical protein
VGTNSMGSKGASEHGTDNRTCRNATEKVHFGIDLDKEITVRMKWGCLYDEMFANIVTSPYPRLTVLNVGISKSERKVIPITVKDHRII